ncbi:hypothetical protein [Bacillus mycoides]
MSNDINEKKCSKCGEDKPYYKFNGSIWYGTCEKCEKDEKDCTK